MIFFQAHISWKWAYFAMMGIKCITGHPVMVVVCVEKEVAKAIQASPASAAA